MNQIIAYMQLGCHTLVVQRQLSSNETHIEVYNVAPKVDDFFDVEKMIESQETELRHKKRIDDTDGYAGYIAFCDEVKRVAEEERDQQLIDRAVGRGIEWQKNRAA